MGQPSDPKKSPPPSRQRLEDWLSDRLNRALGANPDEDLDDIDMSQVEAADTVVESYEDEMDTTRRRIPAVQPPSEPFSAPSTRVPDLPTARLPDPVTAAELEPVDAPPPLVPMHAAWADHEDDQDAFETVAVADGPSRGGADGARIHAEAPTVVGDGPQFQDESLFELVEPTQDELTGPQAAETEVWDLLGDPATVTQDRMQPGPTLEPPDADPSDPATVVPTVVPAPPLDARFGAVPPLQDPATSWQVVDVPGAPPSPPLAPLAMPEPSLKATPARPTPSLAPQTDPPAGSWMPAPAPALPQDAATVIRSGGSGRDEPPRTFDAAAPTAEATRPVSVASLPLPPVGGAWVAQTSQGPQPTPSPAPTASVPLPPLPPMQLVPPPPLPPMPSLASHTPLPAAPRAPSLAVAPAPPLPSAVVTPIRESRIDEKRAEEGAFSSLGGDPAMWLAIGFAVITALVFVAALVALATMIN